MYTCLKNNTCINIINIIWLVLLAMFHHRTINYYPMRIQMQGRKALGSGCSLKGREKQFCLET